LGHALEKVTRFLGRGMGNTAKYTKLFFILLAWLLACCCPSMNDKDAVLARKQIEMRTKVTLEPEFRRADSATDMTTRTGCRKACDCVSTSATASAQILPQILVILVTSNAATDMTTRTGCRKACDCVLTSATASASWSVVVVDVESCQALPGAVSQVWPLWPWP